MSTPINPYDPPKALTPLVLAVPRRQSMKTLGVAALAMMATAVYCAWSFGLDDPVGFDAAHPGAFNESSCVLAFAAGTALVLSLRSLLVRANLSGFAALVLTVGNLALIALDALGWALVGG
jgi:hypothetical protein